VWDALRCGRTGIRPTRAYDAGALPVRFGGHVEGFDAREFVDKKDRKSLKMMCRSTQLAVAGARRALDDAGLAAGAFHPAPARGAGALDRAGCGVSFGSGTIPGDPLDRGPAAHASCDPEGRVDRARWGRDGLPNIPPMWMLSYIPNMTACHVSILNNLQGPNN